MYANEDFKIKIVGLIDLNDGLGERLFELHNEGYLTQDNAAPKVNVSDVVVTQGYVTVDLAVVDPNNTLYGDIVATL